MHKKTVIFGGLTLMFVLAFSPVALAGNGEYPSKTGVPSNNNQTPGTASTSMFGNAQNGATLYTQNCQVCHGPAGAANGKYPGIGAVTDPNANTAMDSGLYDVNPAIFARNLDAMLQHGSNPGGGLSPMPNWGDSGMMSQDKIADVEAYVMTLSNVKWPTLGLNGTTLNGSNFIPGSTVQLSQNGTALTGTATPDTNGNFSLTVNIPTAQPGNFTGNYANLNVAGIYPGGDKTQAALGMDGTKGAAYKVASIPYGSSVTTANMPKTGSNSRILAMFGALIAGLGIFFMIKKPKLSQR
ncbi:MAG: c-type cytochrome [Desulfitobacteriaceae bacterium]